MSDGQIPADGPDWLAPEPAGPDQLRAGPEREHPAARWWKAGAVVLGGAALGAGVVIVAGHASTSARGTSSSMGTPAGGVAGGDEAGGPFPGGRYPGDPGRPGGGPGDGGGIPGEQRLQGTLTAVGSTTVSVTTTSGPHTYRVTSGTQIIDNGRAATLGQLKAGETVLVHVYPSGGRRVVERLFAGSPPGFDGGRPHDGSGPGAPADTGRSDGSRSRSTGSTST